MRAAITSAKPRLPLDAHRSVLNNGPVSAVASYGGALSTEAEAMGEARTRSDPSDRRSNAPWSLSRDERTARKTGAEIGSSLNGAADLLVQTQFLRETTK
jgi:hypothetical protein